MEVLANKKTYLAAAAMAVYAIAGVALGFVEATRGVELLIAAASIVSLRLGIAKTQ
jgi:predicted neutral ceramidase superfamily lipid hydrolase